MADYIRRDIVLEIINTVNGTGGFTGYADYCVLFDKIDTMPAADVQPIDRWISVDDRLPNIGERVFVYIPKPYNHNNIEIAYISEGNDDYPYWVLRDESQFYSTRFHYISQWLPLPEPPKDGDAK